MVLQLKEDRIHGTNEYPFTMYYMKKFSHGFQVPVHWHEEMEIILVEKGVLNIKIGGNEYVGKPGEIFLVNPRELHLMGSPDGKVKYYTFLFPVEFVSFQTADELERDMLAPIRNQQIHFTNKIKDKTVEKELQEYLRALISLEDEDIPIIRKNIQTKILLLQIMEVLYKGECFAKTAGYRKNDTQREMLDYIQENYNEKITLSMLAERFHLSEKYVSNYFIQHFHLPFSNYVIHLRLTEAKRLLEVTDMPVTEVGLQAGFMNTSYFIRAFKKANGISPLKYRQNARGSLNY